MLQLFDSKLAYLVCMFCIVNDDYFPTEEANWQDISGDRCSECKMMYSFLSAATMSKKCVVIHEKLRWSNQRSFDVPRNPVGYCLRLGVIGMHHIAGPRSFRWAGLSGSLTRPKGLSDPLTSTVPRICMNRVTLSIALSFLVVHGPRALFSAGGAAELEDSIQCFLFLLHFILEERRSFSKTLFSVYPVLVPNRSLNWISSSLPWSLTYVY